MRDTQPVTEMAVAAVGRVCPQGSGRTKAAGICFTLSLQPENDPKLSGNAAHDVEQRSRLGLRGSQSFRGAGNAQAGIDKAVDVLAGGDAAHHYLSQPAVHDVRFDSG